MNSIFVREEICYSCVHSGDLLDRHIVSEGLQTHNFSSSVQSRNLSFLQLLTSEHYLIFLFQPWERSSGAHTQEFVSSHLQSLSIFLLTVRFHYLVVWFYYEPSSVLQLLSSWHCWVFQPRLKSGPFSSHIPEDDDGTVHFPEQISWTLWEVLSCPWWFLLAQLFFSLNLHFQRKSFLLFLLMKESLLWNTLPKSHSTFRSLYSKPLVCFHNLQSSYFHQWTLSVYFEAVHFTNSTD